MSSDISCWCRSLHSLSTWLCELLPPLVDVCAHRCCTPSLRPHRLTGKSFPPLPRPPDRRPSPVPLHRPPPPPPPRPRSPPQFQQPQLHPPSASPSSPSLPRPASGSSQGASSTWTSTPPVPPAIRSRTSGAISASAPPDARCRALHTPRT
ncbi:unnamed protein product [Closterium sp. NIES-54]